MSKQAVTTGTTTDRGHNRRPHLFPLLFGLVDAHASRVDYLDTVGGDELKRMLRRRHAVRDNPAHRPADW